MDLNSLNIITTSAHEIKRSRAFYNRIQKNLQTLPD
jgi:hypothetical protein